MKSQLKLFHLKNKNDVEILFDKTYWLPNYLCRHDIFELTFPVRYLYVYCVSGLRIRENNRVQLSSNQSKPTQTISQNELITKTSLKIFARYILVINFLFVSQTVSDEISIIKKLIVDVRKSMVEKQKM